MVDRLTEAGELTAQWQPAFRAVPRHAFIPDLVWQEDDTIESRYNLIPLHRDDSPDRWLTLAYDDDAVIIQVDDGVPAGPDLAGYDITSSASMPLLVSRMLTALEVEPGNRVLEIGTGTGYNAALLAHHLGAQHVTTIEVDPVLAERARTALTAAGYGDVRVITGDGAHGYLPGAPYDRIISTASVCRFPYPWVEQTRPGGRIVTPWAHLYFPALLAYTVAGDGTATGSVADPGMAFMTLRDQRLPRVSVATVLGDHDENTAPASTTDLHPYDVAGDPDAAIAIGMRVPNCTQRYWRPDADDDHGTFWLLDQWSGSWARLRHHPDSDGPHEVRQGGPRRLWDEVEAAYHWWAGQGRPPAQRWRFQVGPAGQQVTLPR
jgi:protein-L-isoaspartate(D-aspartate) O-methyltransferase